MPIIYDIEQDFLYNKGVEKGIINLIKANLLTIREIVEIYEVSVDYIEKLKDNIEN